jgi:hypothetical protein
LQRPKLPPIPGYRALRARDILRRPEIVCAWLEMIGPAEFEAALRWVAARQLPWIAKIDCVGQVYSPRRAVRAQRSRQHLMAIFATRAPGRATRPDEILAASALERAACSALAAGYSSPQLMAQTLRTQAATYFAEITEVVDFSQNESAVDFDRLCRVAIRHNVSVRTLSCGVLGGRVRRPQARRSLRAPRLRSARRSRSGIFVGR